MQTRTADVDFANTNSKISLEVCWNKRAPGRPEICSPWWKLENAGLKDFERNKIDE